MREDEEYDSNYEGMSLLDFLSGTIDIKFNHVRGGCGGHHKPNSRLGNIPVFLSERNGITTISR